MVTMKTFMISWAASIDAENESDAISEALVLMNDPDEWNFHGVVEEDI
jgi:hypothetical protein